MNSADKDKEKLKRSYIDAEDLYVDFVQAHFDTFNSYLQWETDSADLIANWRIEREFRILEGCKAGLNIQALKGNAAAVTNLRALLGMTNAPGRPRGTRIENDPEYQATLEQRLHEDFANDVARLAK